MSHKTMLIGWLMAGCLFLAGSVVLYFTFHDHDHAHPPGKKSAKADHHRASKPATNAPKHDDHAGHQHDHDKPSQHDHDKPGHQHDHGKSDQHAHGKSGQQHDHNKPGHDAHAGHAHGKSGQQHDHNKPGHDAHAGHDHGKSRGSDDHAGHKHGKEGHGGHGQEVRLNSEAVKRVKMRIVSVLETTAVTHQIAAVGRVALPPTAVSRVGSRVEGRIIRWFVQLGQRVKRGHRLALIDSPEVGRARAAYLQASALEKLARIESKRTSRMKRSGLASSKQLLAARVALQKAEINLRSARAQLRILGIPVPSPKQQENLTGLFVLRAPRDGEITAIPYTLGAWVRPQSTVLRIENREQIWVLLEVYGRDVPYVRVGQKVHLYGPGIHHHLEGKITYLASHFERGAQTLEARVVLSNGNGKLRPNQFLYGMIQTNLLPHSSKPKAKALLIPEDAVQRVGRRQIVFVVGDKPGHYQVRTVVTVEAPGGFARVLYGLKPGERVVEKGSFVLKSELLSSDLEGAGHGHAH